MDPCRLALAGAAVLCAFAAPALSQEPAKRPNIVMLMTDDTGWNDFGAYTGGGAALGHPTPNVDRVAEEGATFTNWYGQASCTAGRASFMTGRIPIRSALSIVVVPGDENGLAGRDADDRRVLPEERLPDLLLRQVAPRRQAGVLPDRARLRRDEAFRRLLCRRLRLHRHLAEVPSLVPDLQRRVHEACTTQR